MKRVYVMVGIPGSGKSTWVKNNKKPNSIVLNADSIRKELYGDESIQGDGKIVFGTLFNRFREYLVDDNIKTIYIDNTSVHSNARQDIYKHVNELTPKAKITLVIFKNFEEAKQRNKNRERVVPDSVLDKMIKNFNAPTAEEADKYDIIWGE